MNHPALSSACDRRALVVFSADAALAWLRILKPGFRHCFVLIEDVKGWVLVNPLSQQTEIAFLGPRRARDLAMAYRRYGFRIVPCIVRPAPPVAAPWRPYSCVEAVKRVLGIQERRVWTPWDLYRYLHDDRIGKNYLKRIKSLTLRRY